jgi:hypothetical protein
LEDAKGALGVSSRSAVPCLSLQLSLAKRPISLQTRARQLGGDTHVPDRVSSTFEAYTEAIRKSKMAKATKFGKLVTIQESEHQIITAYEVHDRRPADMRLRVPALDRHIALFDRPPDIAASDRRSASTKNEEPAVQRGVRRVILPRPVRWTPLSRQISGSRSLTSDRR